MHYLTQSSGPFRSSAVNISTSPVKRPHPFPGEVLNAAEKMRINLRSAGPKPVTITSMITLSQALHTTHNIPVFGQGENTRTSFYSCTKV